MPNPPVFPKSTGFSTVQTPNIFPKKSCFPRGIKNYVPDETCVVFKKIAQKSWQFSDPVTINSSDFGMGKNIFVELSQKRFLYENCLRGNTVDILFSGRHYARESRDLRGEHRQAEDPHPDPDGQPAHPVKARGQGRPAGVDRGESAAGAFGDPAV